jgi:hypothetical protein
VRSFCRSQWHEIEIEQAWETKMGRMAVTNQGFFSVKLIKRLKWRQRSWVLEALKVRDLRIWRITAAKSSGIKGQKWEKVSRELLRESHEEIELKTEAQEPWRKVKLIATVQLFLTASIFNLYMTNRNWWVFFFVHRTRSHSKYDYFKPDCWKIISKWVEKRVQKRISNENNNI